jgi:hypothetical protein
MRRFKIITMLILCTIFASTAKSSVYATVTDSNTFAEISPLYINIASTITGLTNSSGKASCVASVTAYSSNTELKVFMYLEKYINGAWTQYGSWYETKTGSYLIVQKNVTASSGTYRIRASYHANGENIIKYSSSRTF